MRKAQTVLEETKDRGKRLIVAADQNIVFDGKMYGKPKTLAKGMTLEFVKEMMSNLTEC